MNFKKSTNNKRVEIPSKFSSTQNKKNEVTVNPTNATMAKFKDQIETNTFESNNIKSKITIPVLKLNKQVKPNVIDQSKTINLSKQNEKFIATIKENTINETNIQNKLSLPCSNNSKIIYNTPDNQDQTKKHSNQNISKEIINKSDSVRAETPKEKKQHSSYFERITIRKVRQINNHIKLTI